MRVLRGKKRHVQDIAAQVDALRSDLNALRKDARELANGVGAAAGSAVNAAEDAYGDIEKWTRDNIGSLRESVHDQPLIACLLSLGIGAVLGALFLRR
jgi:ElaB/YqjD/DUF883 family membrane-anchored ribosome-binding protein